MLSERLGFRFEDEDRESIAGYLMAMVAEKGKPQKFAGGTYLAMKDLAGIELWLSAAPPEGSGAVWEAINLDAHFFGLSRFAAQLIQPIPSDDPQYALHEGSILARLAIDSSETEGEGMLFGFGCPEFGVQAESPFPRNAVLQVTAVPQSECLIFDSYDSFLESPRSLMTDQLSPLEGPVYWSAESFLPLGLFSKESKRLASLCAFTGTVLSAERRTNGFTHASFIAIHVSCGGFEFDVVADEELLVVVPAKGACVHIPSAWLSGRVAEWLC